MAGKPAKPAEKRRHVVSAIVLDAPADKVWEVVGGFFTIHLWHPDIQKTEIGADQTSIPELRRILTFPGQPKTTEQLVFMDNDGRCYRYKWHAGAWGEQVKEYNAQIQVVELVPGKQCLVHWSSTFLYHEDALTQFYQSGFNALAKRFGSPGATPLATAPTPRRA